ncbi:MAG: glucosaminidase, partial [Sneathiella sp.]
TPLDSVRAYMLNLNTNPAYSAFRQKRAAFRQAGKKGRGAFELIKTLGAYSERGEDYIGTLKSIILANDLLMFENTLLQEKPIYSLKPSLVSD